MGTHAYFYLGWFVTGTLKSFNSEKKSKACSRNPRHSFHTGDNFCPVCGSRIETLTIKEMSYMDIEQFLADYEMEDEFFCHDAKPGTVLFVSNYTDTSGHTFSDYDSNNELPIVITDELKNNLYDSLMMKTGSLRLIEQLLISDMKVQFGVFMYYL